MADKIASLGISSLDEQHEALLGLWNALQLAIAAQRPDDEIKAVIDTTLAAGRAHAQHEEALMARTAYPGAAAHQRDHARLLEVAIAYVAPVRLRTLSPAALQESAASLRAQFEAHITSEDRSLGAHLISLATG